MWGMMYPGTNQKRGLNLKGMQYTPTKLFIACLILILGNAYSQTPPTTAPGAICIAAGLENVNI